MRAGDLVMLQSRYASTYLYTDDTLQNDGTTITSEELLVFLGESIVRFHNHSRVLLPSGRVGYVRSSMLTTVQFASVQSCEPVG